VKIKSHKMKKYIYCPLVLCSLLLINACGDPFSEKRKDYEVTILTQKVDDSNKPYPDEIVTFLIPEMLKDCGDTILNPTLKLLRIDLANEVEEFLTVPRSSSENILGANDDADKIKQKLKDDVKISKLFAEPNGQLNEFKLQALIKKFGGAKNVIGYKTDNSEFKVGGEGVMFYSDIKQLRQELLSRVCSSDIKKILVLYNIESGAESTELTDSNNSPTPILGDQNPFTVEFRSMLIGLIQKKTTGEKLKLGKELNEKYFDSQCIVKSYQSLSNPNLVDVYGSDNGGLQYLQYLSTVPSIVDIQIQKIERDLKTNKITALYLFEKHN
jgi:hypothetical protein